MVLEFHNETLFRRNYAALAGGGMVLYNTPTLFQNNLFVEDNKGNKTGGGIYSHDSTVYFHGNTTEFTNGVSRFHGGGFFGLNSSCHFTGGRAHLESNTALRSGGGIARYPEQHSTNWRGPTGWPTTWTGTAKSS